MDIVGLIPSFGNILYTIGAFVIALSVIVAIHEYGHYIVGRWCGIKAEVFSLGFGPVLFSRPDKHGTVWQVAALPFGGFVKFMGDSDAASGKSGDEIAAMDAEAQRHTMHGAPLWARTATVAAGPIFNFILSIIIFGAFAFYSGAAKEPVEVGELRSLPPIYGTLLAGDTIIEVEGSPIKTLLDLGAIADDLPARGSLSYLVERDGARRA